MNTDLHHDDEIKKEVASEKRFYIETPLGRLLVETNPEWMQKGFTVKLGSALILLVEHHGQKIIIKRYPNKKVKNDDEYFNTEIYEIDSTEFDKQTICEILSKIEN